MEQQTDLRKFYKIILTFVMFLACCLNIKTTSACSANQILAHDPNNISKVRCINSPQPPYINLQYPFNQEHATFCSQGNSNLSGSHSHDSILFAVDFLTPPSQAAAEIHAAHSGIAYVYDECNFRKNQYKYSHLDDCGSGYGNHVRVLHPSGYLTMYAHLSKVVVKHKSWINIGEIIGIEGLSGNAGKRHLHFSLHRPENLDLIEIEPGYTGQSIPFNMRFSIGDEEQLLASTTIPCDNNLSAALLRGVKK